MTKKILSIFTTLIMSVSLAGVLPAVTVGAETSGDYEYTVLDDDTVEITGYTGSETELEIPSEIDGKSVTSIGEYGFYCCGNLESVKIPDNVTSIGYGAFLSCENLTNVTIGNGVTTLGRGRAFQGCTKLTSIIIGNKLKSIPEETFLNCTNLSYVEIGNGLTRIEKLAFENCSSLKNITIPNSVIYIGQSAFFGCGLTSITIPYSVTNIESIAFASCSSLSEINVDSNNKNYSSQDGVLFNYNKTKLLQYPIGKTLATYTIPNSVTSIGYSTFHSCNNLTKISIPNSVTSIEEYAFWGCNSLTSFTIPDSVISIGDSAFSGCDDLTIKCYQGSYAEQYAKENNIKYELIVDNNPPHNTDNNSNTQTPNNNSTKPNQTVSPTNNKKTNPSINKVTVPKPAKVKSVKLTAKKKKLNVKWKKVSGATGYEVTYATNNKFTKNKKTVKVKKNKVTITRLKSKKWYFVKVRAYKKANGDINYGKWSKVVKKKAK